MTATDTPSVAQLEDRFGRAAVKAGEITRLLFEALGSLQTLPAKDARRDTAKRIEQRYQDLFVTAGLPTVTTDDVIWWVRDLERPCAVYVLRSPFARETNAERVKLEAWLRMHGSLLITYGPEEDKSMMGYQCYSDVWVLDRDAWEAMPERSEPAPSREGWAQVGNGWTAEDLGAALSAFNCWLSAALKALEDPDLGSYEQQKLAAGIRGAWADVDEKYQDGESMAKAYAEAPKSF